MVSRTLVATLVALAAACGDDGQATASASAATAGSATTATTTPATASESGTTSDGTTDVATDSGMTGSATQTGTTAPTTTTGPTTGTAPNTDTDTGTTGATTTSSTTGEPVVQCKVLDDMEPVGPCDTQAPPNSFEPEVQWSWSGANKETYSIVTPLVANLTDDNGDGEIDLCDIPDIVVVAYENGGLGHIYVLDGATGALHFQIPTTVNSTTTPALGDIDNDGIPEIVAVLPIPGNNPVAFEHDGTLKWQSPTSWTSTSTLGSFALADLDNDGDVEIIGGHQVWDHEGTLLWAGPKHVSFAPTTAADLDGDGDLEVVLGATAFHHDGSVYYETDLLNGFPQIANLDDDPEPEILLTNNNGISLLEHDGTVKYKDLRPTGDPAEPNIWLRPAVIHDLDGDGISDFAVSSRNNYTAYRRDATILWKATVSDATGVAGGTAFDFLGDGVAEAMYADEKTMFVFGGAGEVLLSIPRSSGTGTEYPVVADVDNDGSAEIVVVSNTHVGQTAPTVQVIRDKQDRWIQARRIWNQHTYHVTNVREDGTIPQFEQPSWTLFNTFRTNAQIESGGLCEPIPG